MYGCYRLPFDQVVVDSMGRENGDDASYIRLSCNGNYFFFSYHYLKPVTAHFNSINCFSQEQDIYVVARRISAGNYIVCWLGDCQHIEFKMDCIEEKRETRGFGSILLGMIVSGIIASLYFPHSEFWTFFGSTLLFFFAIALVCSLHSFFQTYNADFIQIRDLMRKDLMKEKDLFTPPGRSVNNTPTRLVDKLPDELCRLDTIIDSVYREKRHVDVHTYMPTTNSMLNEGYTKCMINMVCNNDRFTFEYKQTLFTWGIDGSEISPFFAKGDRVTLYWYEPEYEVIPRDREVDDNGKRLICIYNKTTNTFYQSRLNINPDVFKIVRAGGGDLYKSYLMF